MEFKTYGIEASIESNGDISISQSYNGETIGVILTQAEAAILLIWLGEALKVPHEN